MNKINIIIEREYLSRVRKKSFIIMSILGPLLMAIVIILPAWLSTLKSDKTKKIAVIDKSGKYKQTLKNNKTTTFEFIDSTASASDFKKKIGKKGYYGIVEIPDWNENETKEIIFYSDKQANIQEKSYIKQQIENSLKDQQLTKLGISPETAALLKEKVIVNTKKMNDEGKFEDSSTEVSMIAGLILSLIIYMFIFIYGTQVMRSVIEEKTGRVVELMVSSVKPFQMMMGKIIGVALVALTQVAIWIILISVITLTLRGLLNITPKDMADLQSVSETNVNSISENITNKALPVVMGLPLISMFVCFILYFIGGYLLYVSLFAAIGSAVDSETDTQQFMMPITIPLILSIVLAQIVMKDHDGSMAFWLSQFPLTSPVIMLIRIPFGDVHLWEILLSVTILYASFVGTTFLAAKIYRTGILMYGKKINYKELIKWMKYK